MQQTSGLPRWIFIFLWTLWVTQGSFVDAMFSVHDDLLAYPQFQINFQETSSLTEEEASKRLTAAASFSAKSVSSPSPVNGIEGSEADKQNRWELRSTEGQAQDEYEEVDITWEAMWLKDKRWLCSIPILKPPPKMNETEMRKNKEDEEKEMSRAAVKGWDLLKGLEGSCIYFISGWWSYSYCHNDIVKQFHQLPPANGVPMIPPIEDPRSASYILGKVDSAESAKEGTTEMQANGEAKYLVQKVGGGTYCEITGKGRRVEVQFHCNPKGTGDRIAYIKEVTTCAYLMVINTPRLCADKVFLPPIEGQAHSINCQEIISKDAPPLPQNTQTRPTPELDAPTIDDILYKWEDDEVIKYLAELGLLIKENEDGTFEVSQTKAMDKEFKEGLMALYTAPGNLVVKTIQVENGEYRPEVVTVDEEGEEHELKLPDLVHDEL